MPEDFFYQSDEDLLTDLLDYEFPKEELSKEEEALLASFQFLKIWGNTNAPYLL